MWNYRMSFPYCGTGETRTKRFHHRYCVLINLCLFVDVCSRVSIYVNTFQNLADHQEKFHRQMSKVGGPVIDQTLVRY